MGYSIFSSGELVNRLQRGGRVFFPLLMMKTLLPLSVSLNFLMWNPWASFGAFVVLYGVFEIAVATNPDIELAMRLVDPELRCELATIEEVSAAMQLRNTIPTGRVVPMMNSCWWVGETPDDVSLMRLYI